MLLSILTRRYLANKRLIYCSVGHSQSSTEWKRKPGDVADEPTKEGTAHNNVHHSPRKNHHHHHRLHHHKHNNAKRGIPSKLPDFQSSRFVLSYIAIRARKLVTFSVLTFF